VETNPLPKRLSPRSLPKTAVIQGNLHRSTCAFGPGSADKIAPGAPGASDGSDANSADPNGAVSVFDAVNRQLGLRMEKTKRPYPVLVIDHIEENPTAN
jgi:uncharacterized protein (TIGR03435 family)